MPKNNELIQDSKESFGLKSSLKLEPLLRQTKPHLEPKPGSSPSEGVGYLRVVDGAFEVGLNIQLLVNHVADVGP